MNSFCGKGPYYFMAEKAYRDFVHALAINRENKVFLNSDENHALDVLVEIFQNAKDEVRIFAGSLCKHVGNEERYIVALSDFLDRKGKLRILLNDYNPDYAKNSDLYKRLAFYKGLSEGDIIIKSTKATPHLKSDTEDINVHFTIGDRNSYRLETDIENRTAICNFNDTDRSSVLADFFDKLFASKEAKEIDLSEILK